MVAQLSPLVRRSGLVDEPGLITAVDSAYGYGGEMIFSSAVVTTFPEIEEVERTLHSEKVTFPHDSSLLYFREGPAIIEALAQLDSDPDLIIVHGHGLAHPRRCGLASLIGLAFDRPTIGCARKLLAGRVREVPPAKGTSQPILDRHEEVGIAYRSKENVKCLFISPGHDIDLTQARDYVVRNLRGYRLPEPLRLAHLYANKFRRKEERKLEKRHRGKQS